MRKLLISIVCIVVLLAGCAELHDAAYNLIHASEKLAEKVVSFSFSIGGFGVSNTYSVDRNTLQSTMDLREIEYPRTTVEGWTKDRWDSFITEVFDCGVSEWDSTYVDHNILDGTQWSLEITGDFETINIIGSNAYPDGFDKLLTVISKYFDTEVK